MPELISKLSTEYVKVSVTVTVNGLRVNPTGDDIELAFTLAPAPGVLAPDPEDNDWQEGSWETTPTEFLARCLVGPDGGLITLTPGEWTVWVRVTDNPEIPVLAAGILIVR